MKIPVGAAGEEVCFGVESGGAVANCIFVVVDIGGPAGLAWGEYAGCLKILERLVIGINLEWMMAGFEVDVPVSDGVNDGEHFSVADAVSEFSW